MELSSSHDESGNSENISSSNDTLGFRKILWKIENFDQFMKQSRKENIELPIQLRDSTTGGGSGHAGLPVTIQKSISIQFSKKVKFDVSLKIKGFGKNACIFVKRCPNFNWSYGKYQKNRGRGGWDDEEDESENETETKLHRVKCLATGKDGEIALTKVEYDSEDMDVWIFTPKLYSNKAVICIYFQLSYDFGKDSINNSFRETCCTLIFKDLMGLYNDITLTCSDKISIQANRTVLARFSPVFKRMFEVEEAQRRAKKKSGVTIEDVDSETMQELISLLYTGVIGPVKNAHAFIFAIKKFDLHRNLCKPKLMKNVSEHNAWAALQLADMYHDDFFFSKCHGVLHDTSIDPKASKEFLELPDNVKIKFIELEGRKLAIVDSTFKAVNDTKDEVPAKRPRLDTKGKKS